MHLRPINAYYAKCGEAVAHGIGMNLRDVLRVAGKTLLALGAKCFKYMLVHARKKVRASNAEFEKLAHMHSCLMTC
jgi:hypothetical protein